MAGERADRYDEIAYPSQAFAETHPDRLATLATLFGLTPPPVAHCRLLELGCGNAANLLPLAAALPTATFVGVDRARRPLAAGQAAAAELGLTNLTLVAGDVRDLPADWGRFDYIIAHGLYSWAPAEVQTAVLAVCGRHLAPEGVAYISYAAYPGWHLFGIVRDLLRYATRGETEPQARARAALALLEQLAEAPPDERSVPGRVLAFFAGVLKQRMDDLGEARVNYILHDTLAEVHQPLYLHEFVARAAEHGLHYLTDADLSITLLGDLPPALDAAVRALGATTVEQEQFLDFFRGRAFHKTLLTRQPGRLDREAMLARLPLLWVSSPAQPVAPAVGDDQLHGERFVTADGSASITLDQPLSRAAMHVLIERWPAAVAFADLLVAARRRVAAEAGPVAADAARALAGDLLRAGCVSPQLVGLHVHPPRPAPVAGARPLASPVARYEARFGNAVTNLYHESVTLDGFRHCLLGLLDGSRDRAGLLTELERLAAAGRLSLSRRGTPVTEPAAVAALLRGWLEPGLQALARAALLVE